MNAGSEIVVFRLGEVTCGLDVIQVNEIKKIKSFTKVYRAPSYVRGLVNMRGQIVTLVDVRERLGLTPREVPGEAEVVIVGHQGELVGLLVDEVQDVILAEPDSVAPPPPNLGGVEGRFFKAVVTTPTGLVALVDKDRLAGLEREAR